MKSVSWGILGGFVLPPPLGVEKSWSLLISLVIAWLRATIKDKTSK